MLHHVEWCLKVKNVRVYLLWVSCYFMKSSTIFYDEHVILSGVTSNVKSSTMCHNEWHVTSCRVTSDRKGHNLTVIMSDILHHTQWHLTGSVAKVKHNEWHTTLCGVTPDRSGVISVTDFNLFVLRIFSKYIPHKSQPKMTEHQNEVCVTRQPQKPYQSHVQFHYLWSQGFQQGSHHTNWIKSNGV